MAAQEQKHLVHWLDDVEELTVLCRNKQTGDKFTLEEVLVTCDACRAKFERGSDEHN